ncbi:MAG: C4-dicarboxylate ABC transporter [Rhodospirillaceae bacterium]|nr:C4-dicarboxylate ABC transporter [Rhodospirillaceae bacterium]|tara:strand:- start:14836 stop:16752 length:1917 start_codon:yes stop_codon:yes gene_type:complete
MSRFFLFRFDTWFSIGVRRKPQGWLGHAVTAWGAAIAGFVIYCAIIFIDPWRLSATFLCAMLALVFIMVGGSPRSDPHKPAILDWVMSAIAVATLVYASIHAERVVNRIQLMDELTTPDMLFSSALFFLTLEATRRTTGFGLTAVVLVFVAYNFFGHHFEGVLNHGYIDYNHFLDIMVFGLDGILGLPIRVAASYAFLFVLFGAVLHVAKGGEFFFDLAAAISGKRAGGVAKIAVVSSGLYGMVSGSPTSDVVTTGSITIPMMKRMGYNGALAGSVEVSASTGGSLLPPVMGSAAFMMAEYTGIEYRDIAISAAIPALLYYVSVYAQVHFRSVKLGLVGLDASLIPPMLQTLKNGVLFMVPLAVLTTALLIGYTPTTVALFGTVTLVATAAVKAETRVGLVTFYKTAAETSIRMVTVTGACAAAGLVTAGITMTGLVGKFAHIIYGITDKILFPTLLLGAAFTIVLGLGMPVVSAYFLAALLLGTLFTDIGVPIMAAHMFLLYYAVMSAITPPVAVAAYAAASIAEDNPLLIAALAVKFAIAAFIVPFAFIYSTELLMFGSWIAVLTATITAAAGMIFIASGIEGYFRSPLPGWARILVAAGGLGLIVHDVFWSGLGAVLALVALGSAHFLAEKEQTS